MNIERLIKWFTPKPKYNEKDFILTKPYTDDKGRLKGDLVMRIEYKLEDTMLCSFGRFNIVWKDGKKSLEYSFSDGQKLTQITDHNIERKLSQLKARELLNERVKRLK